MVTISALIFLAGARTMVLTTKIKQLQYINEYDQVFVHVPADPGHQPHAKAILPGLQIKVPGREAVTQRRERK